MQYAAQQLMLNVPVALTEALSNAILYGNAEDPSKRVRVRAQVDSAVLIVEVTDEGPGFDPSTLPDPLAPENLLKSSGRGIFLIRSFMDELVLQRAPEGGMEVRMVKRVQHLRA